jgi:hypothetical protein
VDGISAEDNISENALDQTADTPSTGFISSDGNCPAVVGCQFHWILGCSQRVSPESDRDFCIDGTNLHEEFTNCAAGQCCPTSSSRTVNCNSYCISKGFRRGVCESYAGCTLDTLFRSTGKCYCYPNRTWRGDPIPQPPC